MAPPDPHLTRRQVLSAGLSSMALLGLSTSRAMRRSGPDLVRLASSVKAAGSDLGAVEHVVFLMHENRSFDHYFGTLGGVNGFDASSPAFAQAWPGGASSTLLPYHLDTQNGPAECTFDLSHTWQAQHASWNGGAMDSFVSTHVSPSYEGPSFGPVTMGYYDQIDIPFYYALARAFTVCDNYFCSVLGPTHPNRLMQMTGTLDPSGARGGPVLVTNSNNDVEYSCSWDTMPEVLTDAGVTWKVYNPPGVDYKPGKHDSMLLCKNVLMYFEQYKVKRHSPLHGLAFGHYGPPVAHDNFFTPYPNTFLHDVRHNKLPAVSWVIPPNGYDEHPPAPAALGEWYSAQVIATLASNPEVWAKTVLFIMYDENDGFFDHVPPPVPPPGTPDEYVTKSPLPTDAGGVAGPIGLGVRVPMLVVSPFSAGGWVCSDTFDHTSQLKLLAARFGVPVPNLSVWRSATVGDLTSALPSLSAPVTTMPTLPATSQSTTAPPVGTECYSSQLLELNIPAFSEPYPVPATQSQPTQGADTLTPTPT
jgi:phospholipase C